MLRRIVFVFAVACALAFAQNISEGNVASETTPPRPSNDLGSTVTPLIQVSTTANPSKPSTSAPDTNTSTTTAPHVNTTIAPQSSTTISPTNTTTAPSTNTTTAPSTNTTTAPPTNTTTAPPTNATTASPSTQAPTTPVTTTALPPPSKSHYYVKDGNGTYCIIADLAVQVKLVVDNKTREFDVPANISVGGFCTNVTQVLNLSWDDSDGNYTLFFQFAKDESAKKFMVSTLNLTVSQKDVTLNLTDNKPLFTASVSKSYRCEKEQEIKVQENGTNDTYAILKLSHLQLEAFVTEGSDDKFSAAEDCAGPYSPDIVPIAVGCALVGLIAIVLIAYLVGRRRSQARGYLSM